MVCTRVIDTNNPDTGQVNYKCYSCYQTECKEKCIGVQNVVQAIKSDKFVKFLDQFMMEIYSSQTIAYGSVVHFYR